MNQGMPTGQYAMMPESPQEEKDEQKPEPHEARKNLVKRWTSIVKGGKERHNKVFKRMRNDLKFLAGKQWSDNIDEDRYQANIVQRHIAQRVAALYAKNPTMVCKRRQTLDFSLWNGSLQAAQSLQQKMQLDMQQGMPPDPQIMQTIQDVSNGFQRRMLMDKIASTMEIVAKYTLDEQLPPFKMQMKQLARRTCSTGVGYAKIGLQRFMKKRPEDIEKITDITQRLTEIARLSEQVSDNDDMMGMMSAEAEQLRIELESLQKNPEIVAREGIVIDFPKSTSIIIDPRCTYLRGFLGAKWVAHEFIMSVDDVQEIYNVNLKKGEFTRYQDPDQQKFRTENGVKTDDAYCQPDQVCVWEIYSKTDGLVYTIAEGYCDFLEDPREPHIKLNRFWPIFVLAFNEVESETDLYPLSDVALLRPMQLEYNRLREGLREHRFANRPLTAVPDGMLDPEDKMKLEARPANGVISLKGLQPNTRIGDILQPVEGPTINPQLYDTSAIFEDVLRVVGSQEANLGGTTSSTATESSIAESSRMSALSSNVDDLDDFLSEIARALGQTMLLQLSPETVKKIAGPGAVWPELSAQEVADEIYLDIEAGSSGRPNQAAEIANMQKLVPLLMQVPGISPDWLARELIKRMDDKMDLTDALQSGLQSIVMMNASKAIGVGGGGGMPGNPATDPNMQGAHGANNAPGAGGAPAPQAQNMLPAPGQANSQQTPQPTMPMHGGM